MVSDASETKRESALDALIRVRPEARFDPERANRRALHDKERRVPWRPEDWIEWPARTWIGSCGEPAPARAVREILRGLPGREHQTVVELTRGPSEQLAFLETRFARVLTVDLDTQDLARHGMPGAIDVVVAVDTIETGVSDDLIETIHGALVEGGVFLATLDARPHDPRPFPLRGETPSDGFHEVELQYRLRRAGLQGLRLRRFQGLDGEVDTILCMAVRRALN